MDLCAATRRSHPADFLTPLLSLSAHSLNFLALLLSHHPAFLPSLLPADLPTCPLSCLTPLHSPVRSLFRLSAPLPARLPSFPPAWSLAYLPSLSLTCLFSLLPTRHSLAHLPSLSLTRLSAPLPALSPHRCCFCWLPMPAPAMILPGRLRCSMWLT